jgi:hypothetical protein
MIKIVLNMLAGAAGCAIFCIMMGVAFAVVGNPPLPGMREGLVDGLWLQGMANGQNFSYQSGITAHAGGTQAACQNLPSNIAFTSVDTVATDHDSVCLPFAIAGMNIQIANNSGHILDIYGQSAVNPLTAAADTINNVIGSTVYSPTTQQNIECFSAKNGAWRCTKAS